MNTSLDSRFVDIGDLPTGFSPYPFKKLFLRQFTVGELQLLHFGMRSSVSPYSHIIRAVQMTCSEDITNLTDGDFEYVMAWQRLHSFPKVPLQVSWKCHNHVMVNDETKGFIADLKTADIKSAYMRGYKISTCGFNNVEIVNAAQTIVHTLDDNNLHLPYDDLDFPRVATLSDSYDYILENPHMRHMAEVARWIKRGTTFAAKLRFLMLQDSMDTYERILEVRDKYNHGISEKMTLRCNQCNNRLPHESKPRMLTFFADNSEQDIFNISYNLLSQFGMQPDMNMPAKIFLFHHSTMVKDRQEAELRAKGFKPLG